MNIIEHILTNNPCYRSGRTIIPKGVMVHSPGVAQPNPEVFMRQWDDPSANAGVHAIVSREEVYQLLPWDRRGGHCYFGPKGSGNDTHIGFEICEPAGHTYQGGTMIGYDTAKNAAYFEAVYRNAVELTAQLCKKYNLDPLAHGVVICHSEGYKLGIASNHADVMHWFPKHGKSMDTFRTDVAKEMRGEIDMTREDVQAMVDDAVGKALSERDEVVAAAAQKVSSWAVKSWDKAVKKSVFDGTRPGGNLTREQAAVVLDRLGQLD
jgi:N-acetylmuramoyl-L-alanine amidase